MSLLDELDESIETIGEISRLPQLRPLITTPVIYIDQILLVHPLDPSSQYQ